MGIQNIGSSNDVTLGSYAAGTESTRPASATVGATRFNTTRNRVEIYNGSEWRNLTESTALPGQTVNYLLVGGGGGAGTNATGYGGGGGGGGMLEGTTSLTQGSVYTITIGAAATTRDTNGNNSIISTPGQTAITAFGGGAGGFGWDGSNVGAGINGGNGGGAGDPRGNRTSIVYGGSATQVGGYAGGNVPAYNGGSAGGGGAGGTGGNPPGSGGTNTGGNGGIGRASSITGTSVTYAPGGAGYYIWGGGSNPTGTYGRGESGLGGETKTNGVCIITYPDSVGNPTVLTGSPTMTVSSGTRIYTFTSSGTIGF